MKRRGTKQLWTACADQATAWRASPIAQRVRGQLPRNAAEPGKGLPHLLLNFDSGNGWINRPLRLPQLLTLGQMMQPAEYEQICQTSWHADLGRVAAAHRITVAWIRARLPGYPMIPAPQLARGSALTTREVPFELEWDPAMLGAGLQFIDPVHQIAAALEVSGPAAAAVEQAVRGVVAALHETPTWTRYATALAVLDTTDRAVLNQARRTIDADLRPEKIDGYEPNLLYPRYHYRKQVVADAVAALDGTARGFADAFADIDDLITTACSDVFGQLLFHEPLHIQVKDVERHLDDPSWVSFETDFAGFGLGLSVVCATDDPTLTDLVLVEGEENFIQPDAWTIRIAGRVLNESSHLR